MSPRKGHPLTEVHALKIRLGLRKNALERYEAKVLAGISTSPPLPPRRPAARPLRQVPAGLVPGRLRHHFRGRPVSEIMRQRFPVTIRLALLAFLFEAVIGLVAGVLAGLRRAVRWRQPRAGHDHGGGRRPRLRARLTRPDPARGEAGWFPVAGIQRGGGATSCPPWCSARCPWSTSPGSPGPASWRTCGPTTSAPPGPRACPSGGSSGGHALRNSLIPVITFLGVDLGALMGGAIVTEGIFNLPGIGQAAVHSRSSCRRARRGRDRHRRWC